MYTKLLVPLSGAELSASTMQGSIALARQLGASPPGANGG